MADSSVRLFPRTELVCEKFCRTVVSNFFYLVLLRLWNVSWLIVFWFSRYYFLRSFILLLSKSLTRFSILTIGSPLSSSKNLLTCCVPAYFS